MCFLYVCGEKRLKQNAFGPTTQTSLSQVLWLQTLIVSSRSIRSSVSNSHFFSRIIGFKMVYLVYVFLMCVRGKTSLTKCIRSCEQKSSYFMDCLNTNMTTVINSLAYAGLISLRCKRIAALRKCRRSRKEKPCKEFEFER